MPEVTGYQYLESLDSVRLPFEGDPDDEMREIFRLQLFSEILMTLVLGRDIVVPQSYALDSYGFLGVAPTFLAARDTAKATTEHPFRLHLFGEGVESYDDAVESILARLDDPDRPFVSAAFPELNDPEKAAPPRRAGAVWDRAWLMNRPWLDDQRRAALQTVYREFREGGRVDARPAPHFRRLQDLLIDFVDPGSAMSRHARDYREPEREVYQRLVGAVAALDPRRPVIDQRSSLRAGRPWPGDPRQRTAVEIVGGREVLDEVIEFVDTLYNSVIVGSIGVAAPAFSTGLVTEERRLTPTRIAQHLAIVQYRLRPGEPAGAEGAALPAAGPMFEVREAPETAARARDIRRVYDHAERSLPVLFEERARRGQPGSRHRRSKFWIGLDKLHAAQAASDARAARKALEKHVAYVSKILGRGVDYRLSHEGLLCMAVGATTNAGTVGATCTWPLPTAVQMLIAGAGAVTSAAPVLVTAIPRWNAARRRAVALLEFVDR